MGSQYVCATVVASTMLLGAAACGGGGGDRLSREELVEQGDAICVDFENRVEEVQEPQDEGDIARYIDEVRPIVEEGADELDDLNPPEDLEDDYNRWIELNREGLDSFDELSSAAEEGDEQRMQEITADLDGKQAEADRLAESIGFEECGADA